MDCEICMKIFDSRYNTPMVLIPCGHSICNSCLICVKTCPFCRSNICCSIKNWRIIDVEDMNSNNNENNNYISLELYLFNSAKELNSMGINLIKEKKFDKAIECFTKAHILDDGYIESIKNRALAYFSKASYNYSLLDFQHYLNKFPNDIDTLINIGNCFYFLKDYLNAIKYFNRVIELNKTIRFVLFMKAKCLRHLKMYQAALKVYEEIYADENEELNIEILKDKIQIYFNINEIKKCVEELDKLIRIRQDAIDFFIKAKCLTRYSNSFNEIKECLDNAIKCDKTCIEAYKMKAKLIFEKEKNFSNFIEVIKECLINNPSTRLEYLFDISHDHQISYL